MLCFSGLVLVDLTCTTGVCGPYISSSMMIFSIVIGQFLIWFFSMDYFSICVDGHPTRQVPDIGGLSLDVDPIFFQCWHCSYPFIDVHTHKNSYKRVPVPILDRDTGDRVIIFKYIL